MNQTTNSPQFRTIPGRWVVLGMLGFGIVLTGGLWVYMKLERAPFLPFKQALYNEFPKSRPRVDGGRHKKSPPLLRVVMQVDFSPSETDERVVKIVNRVIALARQHVNLAEFENLEIHVVHYPPEKTPERVTILCKVSELPKSE